MEQSDLNGIINVLKPPGMTSHDVVNFLRRTLRVKKAGHTGTLDPGVAGVLPVCLGKATRIIEYMSDDTKEYRAEVTFGRATDTQDAFGETIAAGDAAGLTVEQVEEALTSMIGELAQIPPMTSAVRHQGRKLYELARQGLVVERKPRNIKVFAARMVKAEGFGTAAPVVLFDIKCSKGTYVRTICHQLGEFLGCGGFMSFLVRTGTGRFKITNAVTLEEITAMAADGRLAGVVLPVDEALPLPAVWIYDSAVASAVHGNRVYQAGVERLPADLAADRLVKIMNKNRGCLGVARVITESSADSEAAQHSHDISLKYVFQPVKVLY